MNKFQPGTLSLPNRDKWVREMMQTHGITKAQAREQYRRIKQDEIWVNDVYQVNIDRQDNAHMVHLSIKRRDKQPIHDWRDLQEIKNQLLGEECEAVELYPAQSRLVDTANQYHLWGIADPNYRFPVGYSDGEIDYESKGNVVQRPLGNNRD